MTGLSAQMLGSRPAGSRRDPASLRPQPRRDGADFWPTPACLIWALIHHVLSGLTRLSRAPPTTTPATARDAYQRFIGGELRDPQRLRIERDGQWWRVVEVTP